ncbi:sugar transferase [Zooshikella marina]|nr:sugar transferase [Zooshikella ganghwensis]MBU2706626.1 sugar transferase [Zooshikella ganghwensis]
MRLHRIIERLLLNKLISKSSGEYGGYVLYKPIQDDRRSDVELRSKIESAARWVYAQEMEAAEPKSSWGLSLRNRIWSATVASLLLLLLSPLLIFIAISIKYTSYGPVFFIQERTGYKGRRFKMIKFRSMVENAEDLKKHFYHLNKHGKHSVDFKIDKDPRRTFIGEWLRRFSLDELPNLFNVIKGDMRLVGPRPTSFSAHDYPDQGLVRLAVYPGITGLWQIGGRSQLNFDERVKLDLQYIENQGFWFDLKILFLTPIRVLEGKGAS